MDRLRLIVLSSGNGTNAENIFSVVKSSRRLELVGLITDRPGAPVVARARRYGVPVYELAVSTDKSVPLATRKDQHTQGLLRIFDQLKPEWALLAGYMRLVSPAFLDYFHSAKLGQAKVVNIHPSLLPAYPGINSYERAWIDQVPTHGATLHYVDSGLDTGEILYQGTYDRRSGLLADFKAAGLQVEYSLYERFLRELDEGKYA